MMEDAELKDALVEFESLRRRDVRRRFESETLLKAVQVLADNPDGRDLVAPMLATIHEALEAEETVVVERRRDGLVPVAKWPEDRPDRSWERRPFVDAVRHGAPRVVFDLARTRDWRLENEDDAFAGASLLAVGLSPPDGARILLCLRVSPPPFSRNDLQLFARIAPLMEQAFLRETERQTRERLEAELRSSQKLEALGTLAGGIAHEINTPLQFVGDNLEFLGAAFQALQGVCNACTALVGLAPVRQTLPREVARIEALAAEADLDYLAAELPTAIEHSREGVRQISRIVLAMKEFSHPSTKDKCLVDLNHALENTVTISRNEWKHVAQLDMRLAPALPAAPCLPGEMNQVFLNLIVNAAHALAEAGRTSESGRITVSTVAEDRFIVVGITDNGAGIPLERQGKVFDPFFTTKEVGKGTGQGLAIAQDIVVNKHRGKISFDSSPGRGTTFTVRLPYGE
ncbi:MAG: ATP-binding protein [Patescibacteria group bacterium]|nr:ATP-binding protein [Patescibacteria group bacterium]